MRASLACGLLCAAMACTPQRAVESQTGPKPVPATETTGTRGAPTLHAAPSRPFTVEPLQLPGRFDAETDLAQLRATFGEANVSLGEVPGGEGSVEPGVVLFADDPARRAYALFLDQEPLARLHHVRVLDAGSRWTLETPAGALRIGSPLADVVRANRGGFAFAGLDGDFAGYVLDWRGGALEQMWSDGRRPALRLDIDADYRTTRGDRPLPLAGDRFDTDDARWPDLAMRVTELALAIQHAD